MDRRLCFIVAIGLLFLQACITSKIKATPEEQAYLSEVMNMPLTFVVETGQADATWGRIQSFIGKYSSMKIQIATDYVFETYNPDMGQYGYKAIRTDLVEETEFTIRCFIGRGSIRDYSYLNAQILAYYAYSGLIYPRFIHK